MRPILTKRKTEFGLKAELVFFYIMMIFFPCAAASEPLQEGTWNGTYSASQYQAKYYVTNVVQGKQTKSNIKMVLPDLEPRFDFTYELKDVLLKDTTLSFTIQKKTEIQKCTLVAQDENHYLGACKSDVDKGEKLIEISMSRPPEDKTSGNYPGNTGGVEDKNKE